MSNLDSHSSARVREISRLMFGEDASGNIVAFRPNALGGILQQASWVNKGAERLNPNAAHAHATIPAGTTMIFAKAKDGDAHYKFADSCSDTGPGFLPQNSTEVIFATSSDTLTFYAAASVNVVLIYYG